MKHLARLLWPPFGLTLTSLLALNTHQAQAQLNLEVGEQRIIRVPRIEKFSVSGEAIRVTRRDQTLFLKAVKPGISELLTLNAAGPVTRSVRVSAPKRGGEVSDMARALSDLEETEVLFQGKEAILRGSISTNREAARIDGLVRQFGKAIQNQTTFSESLLDEAAQALAQWVNHSERLKDAIRVQRLDQGIRVWGALTHSTDKISIERQARSIFPGVELEIETLSSRSPVVHFKVFLLELKKSRFSSFGLSWQDSIRGAFRVSPWRVERNLSLEAAVQIMEGEGLARVLSKPELVVRVPGEAELFSGGELPIKSSNQFATQVQWKNFGLMLKLKVAETTSKQVRVDIQTEISSLSAENALDDVPGLSANRMRTQVDANYGVPLLLSGLIQNQDRERLKGLPGLRHIPVLGRLFESRDYMTDQSELVAILLPNNQVPIAPMARVEAEAELPRGTLPVTSARLSKEQVRALKSSVDYPWNAL